MGTDRTIGPDHGFKERPTTGFIGEHASQLFDIHGYPPGFSERIAPWIVSLCHNLLFGYRSEILLCAAPNVAHEMSSQANISLVLIII
jgi:hypothetical protein